MRNRKFMKMKKRAGYPGISMLLIFVLALILIFSGCSQNKLLSKNANRQHYVDVTSRYLPKLPGVVQRARFARVDKDSFRDLILHVVNQGGDSRLLLLLNKKGRGFEISQENKTVRTSKGEILFFDAGDFNGDFTDDIVVIQKIDGRNIASILFNNKKGYYYKKVDYFLPEIHQGVDRVELVDIDHDRDLDLFFYGANVVTPEGGPDKTQSQAFINNGKGEFQDLSSILLPSLPPGIAGAFFADYDGDGVRDIFLTYGNGRNRLLFNNSLGKFTDNTTVYLPAIQGETMHADWADFDGDEDNDLLVLNRRTQSKELCYFLENNGKGRFTKKSHKALAVGAASRVYLLDANGNGIPDALILSAGKTHYLQGKGEWRFSDETVRRLPRSSQSTEMAFGDIDDDGYLDVFSIDSKGQKAKLWLNRFE